MEFRNLDELGSDMEIRSDGDGRTISGIAVPWNRPTRINDKLTEEFMVGAFDKQLKAPNRIPLAREHMPLGGQLIGRVVALRNDKKGLYVEARVAETSLGEETLALLREKALEHWSIGFRDLQNLRTSSGVTQRVKAQMVELAIVLQGAYGDHAAVGAMRSDVERPGLEAAARILNRMEILPPLPRTMRG